MHTKFCIKPSKFTLLLKFNDIWPFGPSRGPRATGLHTPFMWVTYTPNLVKFEACCRLLKSGVLGHKVICVWCINCSHSNIAKGFCLLDNLYRKKFIQVRDFESNIPLILVWNFLLQKSIQTNILHVFNNQPLLSVNALETKWKILIALCLLLFAYCLLLLTSYVEVYVWSLGSTSCPF